MYTLCFIKVDLKEFSQPVYVVISNINEKVFINTPHTMGWFTLQELQDNNDLVVDVKLRNFDFNTL